MDNRPIKGNPSGNYNMNFIDPTNDIPSYYDGMVELEDIIEKYFDQLTYKKPQITKTELYKSKIGVDTCAVCLQNFVNGEKVKVLPCKHCFHEVCVMPWFSKNSKCPNCRFDLGGNQE